MINKLFIVFLYIEITLILIQLKDLKNLKSKTTKTKYKTAKTFFIIVSIITLFHLFCSLGITRIAISMKNKEIVKARGVKEINFSQLKDIIENKNYGVYTLINESELNEDILKDIKRYMPEKYNNLILSGFKGSKRYIIFIPRKEYIKE